MKSIYVYPGQWAFAEEPTMISTILGSCVAVCIYDGRRKVGGLNHYLLPEHPPGEEDNTRYGSVALPRLLDALLESGSRRGDLIAKVYGGANVLTGVNLGEAVGENNVRMALRFLQEIGMRIVDQNTGGLRGRKIKMNSETFEITHSFMKGHGAAAVESGPSAGSSPTAYKPSFAPSFVPAVAGSHTLLAIGSSTGGTEALKDVLKHFGQNVPPTVIVQHMQAHFTKSYAEHLNALCPFTVKEAKSGDVLKRGTVLLAPGDFHMEILPAGPDFMIRLHQEPFLHGVRPAADYLFRSVARHVGKKAMGVILTGMGRDGAEGLLEMRKRGAFTIAQDQKSCVVFGMPKAAIELNAVDMVLSLKDIGPYVAQKFGALRPAA